MVRIGAIKCHENEYQFNNEDSSHPTPEKTKQQVQKQKVIKLYVVAKKIINCEK
jgi:hypothetical protein